MDTKQNNRKLLMIGVFVFATLVMGALFALEFTTDTQVFSESIIGLIIGSIFGLLTAYVAFYTTESEKSKDG